MRDRMATDHEIHAANVRQIVRLERRLAEVADGLRGLGVTAAARSMADDASNGERAAWGMAERQAARLLALAVGGQGSGVRGRTASGPGGDGGTGGTGETPGPGDPLLEPVTIAIPAGLVERVTAARWWIEEEQRATEAYLFDRADDIRRKLIQPFGLLYAIEAQIGSLAALLTGAARCDGGK